MKLKGELLLGDDGYFFRVYDKKAEEGFIDYELNVHDMSIEIDDECVTAKVDKEGNHYIDYTDEVLGY